MWPIEQLISGTSHAELIVSPVISYVKRVFLVFDVNQIDVRALTYKSLTYELPSDITSAPLLSVCRKRLKTFLFRRSFTELLIRHLLDVVLEIMVTI